MHEMKFLKDIQYFYGPKIKKHHITWQNTSNISTRIRELGSFISSFFFFFSFTFQLRSDKSQVSPSGEHVQE